MSDFQILNSVTSQNSWVGALSVGQEFNWPICKEKSLWGTGSNNAVGVKKGDEFFLWQSGAGWSARCIVTTDARRPSLQDPAPWDDGREYKWIFGISVIKELESPFSPGSTNNRQNISNLPNIKLGSFRNCRWGKRQPFESFLVTLILQPKFWIPCEKLKKIRLNKRFCSEP